MGACGSGGRQRPGLAGDERGSTAIEYALLASVVAITAIAGLRAFASGAGGLFGTMDRISQAIRAAVGG